MTGMPKFICKICYLKDQDDKSSMITGDIKNKVDALWEDFWTAGITNSLTVVEQMTYLLFMKLLDDKQIEEEKRANIFHQKLLNPTFPDGLWTNSETGKQVPYNDFNVDHC